MLLPPGFVWSIPSFDDHLGSVQKVSIPPCLDLSLSFQLLDRLINIRIFSNMSQKYFAFLFGFGFLILLLVLKKYYKLTS